MGAVGSPDPSKFVSVDVMANLQTQLAALTAEVSGTKVAQLVATAIEGGKLLPVQKDWAIELGKTNLGALTSYLEKTPALAALAGQQSDGVTVGEAVVALTSTDTKVAQMLGLSNEEFAASKAQS